MEIDLNTDLGEGCGTDEALLDLVSSANIACGWHAGSATAMRECVRWAVEKGVAIGAHPSFNDPENFGRKEMDLPPEEIYAGVLYQLGAQAAIVQAEGGRIAHVKPHGALYNQAAKSAEIADAICSAVLPQMLGLVFSDAGVGKAVAHVKTAYVNMDYRLVAVAVYVIGAWRFSRW